MIQVYTGEGKGKTTAALGLALRAAGAGKKVFILQFIKGRPYSELVSLKKITNITLEQCGRGCFIKKNPAQRDIDLAGQGLHKAAEIVRGRKFDVVILDEANVCLQLGLLQIGQVLSVLRSAPACMEVILTGRGAPQALVRAADLVSEIKDIKHYYRRGIKARKGIEF